MGLFGLFSKTNKHNSAQTAKNRLLITVAHQRNGRNLTQLEEPPFMDQMKREILDVVCKYIKEVNMSDIETNIDHNGSMDVLTLNINLPEEKKSTPTPVAKSHNPSPKDKGDRPKPKGKKRIIQ